MLSPATNGANLSSLRIVSAQCGAADNREITVSMEKLCLPPLKTCPAVWLICGRDARPRVVPRAFAPSSRALAAPRASPPTLSRASASNGWVAVDLRGGTPDGS